MTVEGIRVPAGWLALREPADAAARARDLVELLPATGRHVIHDLGGGSGAMGRWLAPLLPGPQHWVLHDRDAELLEMAVVDLPGRAADGAAVAVETRQSDITWLQPDDLADATLITASALLDLMTGDELDGLVAVCAGVGCPVLLTLSVVGRVELTPTDPLDARVAAAFDAHQRRATPRGRLLGPDAVEAAAEGFRRVGADVVLRPSPWRLGADDAELTAEWFTGWVGAACEQEPEVRHRGPRLRTPTARGGAAGRLAVAPAVRPPCPSPDKAGMRGRAPLSAPPPPPPAVAVRRGRAGSFPTALRTVDARALVHGVMMLVASLPGAVVLVVAWFRRTRLPERPEPQLSWRISGVADRAADA